MSAAVPGPIRRIPVVDRQRHLAGIVTRHDLAQALSHGRPVPPREIAETLAAVSQPRRGARPAA